jgi:hypothetical protein
VVDDAAAPDELDDDDVDPHPQSAAAIMATTTVPALMRARLDLNMGATPPLDCPRAGPR